MCVPACVCALRQRRRANAQVLRATLRADVFEEIKRYPRMMQLFISMDEADALFLRVQQAASPHERAALLSFWNVAPQEKKTGQAVVTTPIFKTDLFCNVQPALLADCIIHEVRDGRGLLPRFIMLAGSKKHFTWATGSEADYAEYMRRLALRLKHGGRAVPSQSDCLANLLLASIVYLHEVPSATRAILDKELQTLRRLAAPTTPTRPSEEGRASQALNTPDLMRGVGWKVSAS